MTNSKIKVNGMGNLICDEANIPLGTLLTLGDKNIIHPKCTIFSEGGGPIIIGNCNIIEENVTIFNWGPNPLIIGDNNLFEVGAYFEGVSVKDWCVFEPKSVVAEGTTVASNCVIGAKCSTRKGEAIPEDTVIFGSGHERRTQTKQTKTQTSLHARHLEYLSDVLRKFHSQKQNIELISS